MMSVAVLKGPVAESGDGIDNNHNGIIDEPDEHCMMNHFLYYNGNNSPCFGNPNGAEDFYFYLRSLNRCGNHFTYGGVGNGGGIGGTNIPCDYFFPGMPYDTGWTEASAGINPDDRRLLPSSGPFSLRKGEIRTIDFAYIFTRDESAPNGLNTSIAKNLSDVEKVKRWYDTDSFPCKNSSIGVNEIRKDLNEFFIHPNPATGSFTATRSITSGEAGIDIINVLGEVTNRFRFPAGRKELRVSTNKMQSGIYFVKLVGEKYSITKKLIIQ